MKKSFKLYAAGWLVLFITFNVLILVLPSEIVAISKENGTFWIGYILMVLSFIGQLVCAYTAFSKDNLQRFFYNISLISISYISTIVSIVVSLICITVPIIPFWIGSIICLLILAFSVISIIKAKMAIDIIEDIDEKESNTSFIRNMANEAELLWNTAQNDTYKTELKKVYEALRYSDPVSNEQLSSIEHEMEMSFNRLKNTISNGDEDIISASKTLLSLIKERNLKCKMSKK